MGPRFIPWKAYISRYSDRQRERFRSLGADQLPDAVSGLGRGGAGCSWRGTQEDKPWGVEQVQTPLKRGANTLMCFIEKQTIVVGLQFVCVALELKLLLHYTSINEGGFSSWLWRLVFIEGLLS